MRVFKFGGGVLKRHEDVLKLVEILQKNKNDKIIVVVSAFNKVTSKLEKLLNYYFDNKIFNNNIFNEIKHYHDNLISDLFGHDGSLLIHEKINDVFDEIYNIFKEGLSDNFHFEYDRIVSFGELLSSLFIFEFLKYKNISCEYKDSRKLIITDSVYTEAKVDWQQTSENIVNNCNFNNTLLCVTQGFIASNKNGDTTTLGREGSDFTASIYAYVLDAEELIFWKEVDGIYNADPAKSDEYELLPKLSYREVVEQAYYGAKILHPKTIKPLQNKKVSVKVKSFYKDLDFGTSIMDISKFSPDFYPNVPIYIVKDNQILVSVSTKDFSFISEYNLGEIFSFMSKHRVKVNLMQSSAINFSVCVTNNKHKIPSLIEDLKSCYNVLYNDVLSLITIRHYNEEAILKMVNGKEILVEQKSRQTARFVVK